mmetsp:Transcript_14847/g.25482  ORF Transcript_14847/g.25482 Transcript_14847/m.25482 type:complete len:217 (+) Transcript_14847:726-1376(+)
MPLTSLRGARSRDRSARDAARPRRPPTSTARTGAPAPAGRCCCCVGARASRTNRSPRCSRRRCCSPTASSSWRAAAAAAAPQRACRAPDRAPGCCRRDDRCCTGECRARRACALRPPGSDEWCSTAGPRRRTSAPQTLATSRFSAFCRRQRAWRRSRRTPRAASWRAWSAARPRTRRDPTDMLPLHDTPHFHLEFQFAFVCQQAMNLEFEQATIEK